MVEMNGDLVPLGHVTVHAQCKHKGKPSSLGIVIPSKIRQSLNIQEGDEMQLLMTPVGKDLVLHHLPKQEEE